MNKAIELARKLSEMEDHKAALSKELTASLMVQEVWPEAFEGGCSTKLCARETLRTMQQAEKDRKAGKVPELQRCYLKRSDGVEFELDAATYWTLREINRAEVTR